MGSVAEAVKRQQFGFFHEMTARGAGQVGQNVDRQTSVAAGLPAHLQAESNVAYFEYIGAAVVLNRISAGHVQFAGRGFNVTQDLFHLLRVHLFGDLLVSGRLQHDGQIVPDLLDSPVDGVAIGGVVHPELFILFIRTVYIALFNVETVEPQQRRFVVLFRY